MEHKELDVWKRSIQLVTRIYEITRNFPDEEKFGLTSQMRRSAISIPSNIAEGCGRKGDKELIQFLYTSLGSASELETQVIIAGNLKYLEKTEGLLNEIADIKKMILGLRRYLSSKH